MSLHLIFQFPFITSPNHKTARHLVLSTTNTSLFLFYGSISTFCNLKRFKLIKNEVSGGEDGIVNVLNDQVLLNRVAGVKDANQALEVIGEMSERSCGVVSTSDCCSIISGALDRNNVDLALSVFYAMRSSFDQGVGANGNLLERWKWSRPDVSTFGFLVRGLAASLRVSDALRIIACVCRVRVSPREEVPFGKIVNCPSCMISVAVAQPQHGIQHVLFTQEHMCMKLILRYSLFLRISSCRTQHGSSSMGKRANVAGSSSMDIENLEERWRLQAEANEEVERLLSSQPTPREPH